MPLTLIATSAADYAGLTAGAVWNGSVVPPGGLEPADTLKMLAELAGQLQRAQGWGTWVGVCDGEIVVSIAVKSPLAAGIVDIGYGVAPNRRGRGHATAAVLALLPILRLMGALRVTASAAVSNPASGRVLTKAGFIMLGHSIDPEDGPLTDWGLKL